MRDKLRVFVAVGLFVVHTTAFAQAQEEPNCDGELGDMPQMVMNFCSYQLYQEADAKLNVVWKNVKDQIRQMDVDTESGKTEAMDALVSGQRGWIAFRDGECVIAGFEAYGGSLRPTLENNCLAEMTKLRTKQLTDFLAPPDL